MRKGIFLIMFALLGFAFAQTKKPLKEVEKELQKMAFDILNHDSLGYKLELNKKFATLFNETLQRPESYDYPFDSLKTISILSPADKSFRIFTWYVVDQNFKEFYGDQYHYYFGFIQRKYEENGKTEYIVLPLIESQEIANLLIKQPKKVPGYENILLDNYNWLGALYYKEKNHSHISTYTISYIERPKKKGDKPKKVKQKMYLLMGWNGADNQSNYKVIEVMSFDPNDKERAIFGADAFYFGRIPKYRGIFRYSEYAPFTMNFGYMKTGPFKRFKTEAIVYDHLDKPLAGQEMAQVWEIGPDGSYDALKFYKKGGYFEWYRNVDLAATDNNKLTKKRLDKLEKEEREKQLKLGVDIQKGKKKKTSN